jgi:hypothetical protein
VVYTGEVNWPISLQTTQTLNTISLLSGIWGFQGSLSSTLGMEARSSGAPGRGEFQLDAGFSLPTGSRDFSLQGATETTLACDGLTMSGQAGAEFPLVRWEQSLNPLQAIPGAASALCSLGSFMCALTESFGLHAEAQVTLGGNAEYGNTAEAIQFTGGNLGGDIEARFGVSIVPPPLNKIATLNVEGGGTGCLEFQVAPAIELNNVGGEVFVALDAGVLFLGETRVEETWPFGGGCSGRHLPDGPTIRGAGGVPRDAQLAMSLSPAGAGAAAWSAVPVGQSRPSGDIVVDLIDAQGGSTRVSLTDDPEADFGPVTGFDADGNLLVCHQRNPALPLPTSIADLDTFAAGFEIACGSVTPEGNVAVPSTLQTNNGDLDFGPTLAADVHGMQHLFWQRTDGTNFTGSAASPASLWTQSWDGAGWSPAEAIATGLTGVFGWTAAAHDADVALIAISADTDNDLQTSNDREIQVVERSVGGWTAPIPITANAVADLDPIAGHDCSGQPVVLWRRDTEVLGVIGNLTGAPETVVGADLDVGPGFAEARLACKDDVLHLVWVQAVDLWAVTRVQDAWSAPERINGADSDVNRLLALRVDRPFEPQIGSSRTDFLPDLRGLATEQQTEITEVELNNTLFESGFESP